MSGEKALYHAPLAPTPHWESGWPSLLEALLKHKTENWQLSMAAEQKKGKPERELKLKVKQLPPLALLLLLAKIYGNVLDIVELNAPFIFKYPH